jgi:hypothetical protein
VTAALMLKIVDKVGRMHYHVMDSGSYLIPILLGDFSVENKLSGVLISFS